MKTLPFWGKISRKCEHRHPGCSRRVAWYVFNPPPRNGVLRPDILFNLFLRLSKQKAMNTTICQNYRAQIEETAAQSSHTPLKKEPTPKKRGILKKYLSAVLLSFSTGTTV